MPEAETPRVLRPCAYHVVRYTPNLVRDEWVNIGILLFDPAGGRLLQRMVEEPAEFARIRRLHPAADEELLRRLSDDFALQSAAADNNAQSYIARLEQTLSNTLQLSPQKGLLAEEMESVPARTRSFAERESGRACNAACAWMNSLTRAIRCAWITATGAMARADSFKRSRFLAILDRPKFWRLRPMLSAKSSTTRNLLLSRKRSHGRQKTPGIVSFWACSRPVKSALCRCRVWPNGPIACAPLCSGAAIIRHFGMTSKAD